MSDRDSSTPSGALATGSATTAEPPSGQGTPIPHTTEAGGRRRRGAGGRIAFILALRVQGASIARIVWLHIVPNVMAPFLVQATFVFAEAVLSEAALSFLGLGIKAPAASWGNIQQAGKNVMRKAWWMIFFPAAAIIASVLSLNLAGDGLRDALDPKTKED